MTGTAPILALDNVSKVFHRGSSTVHAARNVSFALHPGRTLALVVGPTGSTMISGWSAGGEVTLLRQRGGLSLRLREMVHAPAIGADALLWLFERHRGSFDRSLRQPAP